MATAAPAAPDSFEGSAATPLKPPKPKAAPKVEDEPKMGVGDDACEPGCIAV